MFIKTQTVTNEQFTADHFLKHQREDGQTSHENIENRSFQVIWHGQKLPEIASCTCWPIFQSWQLKGFFSQLSSSFTSLITYILFPRIFVAPPRYNLLCSKSQLTHFPEATAVKLFSLFTISVPCNPSRIISTWYHCPSCKVKSVLIVVTPCLSLNLHLKKHKRKILSI